MDHPRSRGVYSDNFEVNRRITGSSPLARGLLCGAPVRERRIRIIPARVGFTDSVQSVADRPGDHPRSRGVYIQVAVLTVVAWGSSPLARGLLLVEAADGGAEGIIPARAGFTTTSASTAASSPDHPRSRGVYYPKVTTIIYDEGSSPLARGLQSDHRSQNPQRRIIPARAGFTLRAPSARRGAPDHPRSRGVYVAASGRSGLAGGSSPLARGLLDMMVVNELNERIIPARAGFTLFQWPPPRTSWDHPRSRGVYATGWPIEDGQEGSSPLARGLRVPAESSARPDRIIPARAGFTEEDGRFVGAPQDHPRSRGVYPVGIAGSLPTDGSSPLARGLLVDGDRVVLLTRIIPARAGFTAIS